MIRFWAIHAIHALDEHSRLIQCLSKKPAADPVSKQDSERIKLWVSQAKVALKFMAQDADCKRRLGEVEATLDFKMGFQRGKQPSNDALKTQLVWTGIAIRNDLESCKFVYVPASHESFFEQDKLFGEPVYDKFKSARDDLKCAGNCLAADLHTAAVFHLMRVAERGIRVLAYDRRVRFNKGPIEMQDWKAIIDQLQNEISKIGNWMKSPQRAQAEEFYNTALSEFRGFKDAWRNHVMHARRDYGPEDVSSVFSHVNRFMRLLSTRISETERTPLTWTKKQILREP